MYLTKFKYKVFISLLIIIFILLTPLYTYAASLSEQRNQAANELQTYKNSLEDTMKEIENISAQIETKLNEITETNVKLEEAELKQNQQYEDMKMRIRCIYEMGNYQVMENILESKSFTDFINNVEYISVIQKYDQKKLKEYKENFENIKNLKKSLEEEQIALEALKSQQENLKNELNASISSKENEINELDQKIQEELNQLNSSSYSSSEGENFTRSGNAYSYGESDLDLICAIVAQECNSSYEGALAVITCALNRAESGRWQYLGADPLSQLKARGQFCYSIDTHWQKRLNGNYPDYVKQAVLDGLNGARNHSYLSFRGYPSAGSVNIGGNWYFSPM